MIKTLTQVEKEHDTNRLHDAFIAAELVPSLVESDEGESRFTFADGTDEGDIQDVIDAYTFTEPAEVLSPLAALAALVPSGGGVDELRGAVIQYKEYVALFSQTGLTDPEVTELKNAVGEVVWTRESEGVYVGTLAGAFPPGRTVSPNKFQMLSPPTASDLAMSVSVVTEDSVSVETTTYSTGAFIDGALDATLVEIRVYDEL